MTEDGRYLIINVWHGTERKNRVFYKELTNSNAPVVELLTEADASYGFVGNDGPRLLVCHRQRPPRANG